MPPGAIVRVSELMPVKDDAPTDVVVRTSGHRLRNVVLASLVGGTVEWYDFSCRDRVTLTGLDAEDADDLADGLSWIARRDEERRNGPG